MSNASEIVRLLSTSEAAQYLAARGVKRTPKTLTKYRCTGEGPAFRKIGAREVAYTEPALDDWARSLIGPEVHSTAEIAA